MYKNFDACQQAYDNKLPPSYYDTEPEDKERWLESFSIADSLDSTTLDEWLYSLLDGNAENVRTRVRKYVDEQWEKEKCKPKHLN